jgi:hypothetical protein
MRPDFQNMFVKKLPRERLVPVHTSQRYFEEIFSSSGFAGNRGLTSSICTIGPMSCKGPWNFTKLGGESARIQQS